MVRPKRVCTSCLCAFKCSVNELIRAVNNATCTSGEPVSFLLCLYVLTICAVAAVVNAMNLFSTKSYKSIKVEYCSGERGSGQGIYVVYNLLVIIFSK